MKKHYFLGVLLLVSCTLLQAQVNYYVSADGNDDSNTGLSQQSPWKTLAKVNTIAATFNPGDSILFRRGDVFRGELLPQKSGTATASITYGAYGTGSRPIINGSQPLSGWSVFQGNVWVADYAGSITAMNNFFINGTSQQIGRYPNADATNQGYLRIQSGSGNTILNDNSLAGQDWTGATAVVRVNLFLLNKPVVQSHTGSTLTFVAPGVGNYTINAGYGYFLQNHLATLDQPGEWYFDQSAKKVYLYSTTNPNQLQTEAPVVSSTFFASGKSHLSIQQLVFTQANEYGIRIDSTAGSLTQNIRIQSCQFNNNHNAMLVNRAVQVLVSDNTFNQTNNNAIFITARDYVCNRNTILNTALRAGMGEPNNNQYNAINLVGRNATAANNVIDSVGYCGIRFEGTNLLVQNNQVSNFARVKCDIGGIYTFKGFAPATYGYGNNRVIGNVVSQAYPNLFGTTSRVVNSNYACGIYMDGNSLGNLVEGNTVYQVMGAGLMLNVTTSGHTVRNNTFYDNMYGFGYFPDSKPASRNHRVVRNIFYARSLNQQGGLVQTGSAVYLPLVGTLDSNYYSQPFEKDPTFVQTVTTATTPRVSKALTLNQWQQLSYDTHGVYGQTYQSPVVVQSEGPNRITVSNNSQFNTGLTTGTTAYTLTPASGTSAPAWDNTGQLDGGSLRLNLTDTTTTKSSRAVINVGTITFGKYYRLRFSAKGSRDTTALQVALLSSASSNFGVCKLKTVTLSTTRTEVELLLSPNYTNDNTFLSLTLHDPQSKIWLDNIVFSELEVTENDPTNYVRFEVNADSTSRTVNLGGETYTDVRGATYTGTYTVLPFSSVILQKQISGPLPLRLLHFSAADENCNIRFRWKTADERNINRFIIEQSADGKHFVPFTFALPTGKSRNNYSMLSLISSEGINYFRLKILDEDQSYAYSSIISLQQACQDILQIDLYPNPAPQLMHLRFQEDRSTPVQVSVLTTQGRIVIPEQTFISSPTQQVAVQIGAIPSGTYLVKIQREGKVYIKKLIK
ncbi:T9SS type A sorting domain-containing protein [Siphonobacter curvatus]|uniref:Secretion system C-terminal sorting domain-containing protein n=1 Tax=Siphonobacter curvatus TaxID=2094562 RepID=A0A2S7IGF1_9BACT|nr:T9SS type A sorting domain-containing protein [Siphonobacter curvatus]PQA54485.1 hypothetical protein C5O19_22315 [Siphonobacter curvatus]